MPTPFEAPALWAAFAALGATSAALSAIVGLAGGVLLLGGLLLYLEPLAAIPVHGVAQLVSNVTRATLQREHIAWPAVGPFLWLLLPGAIVGVLLIERIPPDGARLLIGLFALAAIWIPTWFRVLPADNRATVRRRFLVAGGVVGVANMLVGATGPILAPFVLSLGLERFATVGTLAICQAIGHFVKIGVFTVRGFAFLEYAAGLALLCASIVVGSWLGTHALRRLPERGFQWLIRAAVTAVALRLIWQGSEGLR